MEETPTPASASAVRNRLTVPSSTRGWLKKGVKSSRGDSSIHS